MFYKKLDLTPGEYGLVTFHRAANVDPPDVLGKLCKALIRIASKVSVVFPIHPRTRKNLEAYEFLPRLQQVNSLYLIDPLSYLKFMNLLFHCRLVITDSGGLQEETTYLGIPCLTVRPNTERPITIKWGTNKLCKPEQIEKQVDIILANKNPKGQIPELWDGQTAMRIVRSIRNFV